MPTAYEELLDRHRDLHRLNSAAALLEWDQETGMPPRGMNARAEQLGLLAGLAHDQLTAARTGELLDALGTPDDAPAAANVREIRRAYERATKLPTALVKRLTETAARAKDAWAAARKANAFGQFAPFLDTLLGLQREVAERIGYETEAYDALMDEFEPGARAADIAVLFEELGRRSTALVQRLQGAATPPDPAVLKGRYPTDQQLAVSRQVAAALGFDFDAGRLDTSLHPFCTTIGGCGDVRITTRFVESDGMSALYSTLHEAGHALYEQGLPAEHTGTPLGDAVSMGIHESQSRMWENLVGRSRPFVDCHLPHLQQTFAALKPVGADAFYRAINIVKPSLIRVEADELTYNLHIVLRFQLERDLIAGRLAVADVPEAWNSAMGTLLGITPPTDADGCLQDIHWSMGAYGYFPTYALGNLYASQFFDAARRAIPDLMARIAANDHRPLLDWLREHIHRHGRLYRADALVQRVTGQPLSIEPFMTHVTTKFSEVYGL